MDNSMKTITYLIVSKMGKTEETRIFLFEI